MGSYVKNGYRFSSIAVYGKRAEAWVIPIDQEIVGLVGNNKSKLKKLSDELNIPIYSSVKLLAEKEHLFIDSLGIHNIQATISTLNQFVYKYKLLLNKNIQDKNIMSSFKWKKWKKFYFEV